jgi:hypothetical protein
MYYGTISFPECRPTSSNNNLTLIYHNFEEPSLLLFYNFQLMFLPISQNLSPSQLIITKLKFSGRLVWLLDKEVDAGGDAGDGESSG